MPSRSQFSELEGNDPYELLGVGRDATDDDVKRARRRLQQIHHPDINNDESHQSQLVNVAATILTDPIRRAEYDEMVRQAKAAAAAGTANQYVSRHGAGRGGGHARSARRPPTANASWPAIVPWALTLAFCCSPLGLVLSVIALDQVRKARRDSAGPAYFALAISVLGTVALSCAGFWAYNLVNAGD